MSVKEIRSPAARPLSVSPSGDVFVWVDDSFTGIPMMIGDFAVNDIIHRFGYRTSADLPPEVIQDAWWEELRSRLNKDEYRFVAHVTGDQRAITDHKWRVYAFRTSNRLFTERVAFRLGANDKDHDAWRRIKQLAESRGATVEVGGNFFHGDDPAFPVTIVELWWEHGQHPPINDRQLEEFWQEFGANRYGH